MGKMHEERARKLVNRLERTGTDCGLLAVQGSVVLRCPSAPYNDSPTTFNEADLQNAVTLGLLEKRSMAMAIPSIFLREPSTASIKGTDAGDWIIFSWAWYVSKRKQPKFER